MAAPVFSTGDVPTAAQVNTWFVNILFARKTADETISSSTTLQNDDHLFVSVAANTVYDVTLEMRELSQPGDDFKLGFTMPASATFTGALRGPATSATGFSGAETQSIEFTGGPLAIGGVAGVNLPISVRGLLITAGTAGTLQIQWAQNSSSASGTTVKANSYLLLRQVA